MGKKAPSTDDPDSPENAKSRRPLYAELTPSAYEAWNSFADRYGVSVTAVLEAIGQELDTSPHWNQAEIAHFPPPIRSVLEHARLIGQERRRRRKT